MVTELDDVLRLIAAAVVGMVIGVNRDLANKPIGMRTLALVALGSALVSLTTIHYSGLENHPDALSRVVQGIIQGVLTGIGFIGAGVVIHDRRTATVHGLTTAATVWVTAALGIACALAAWPLVIASTVLTVIILFALPLLEGRLLPTNEHKQAEEEKER